jgi:hypothetical protein
MMIDIAIATRKAGLKQLMHPQPMPKNGALDLIRR